MEELVKHRSITSCIVAAWHTWRDDNSTILRSTWLPILVTSLAGALHSFIHLSDASMSGFREANPIISGLMMAIAALGMFMGMAWLLSRLFNYLNQKGRAYNQRRAGVNLLGYAIGSSVIMAIVVGILILCGVSFSPTPQSSEMMLLAPEGVIETPPFTIADIPWWVWHLGGGILVCFLLLPLVHHSIRYQMEPDTLYIKHMAKGLKGGLKNWGFLFGTTFVTGMILALVSIIPTLPLILLHTAEAHSTIGVIEGDPSGMPTSIPWVYALTSFIVGSLMLFVWQILILAQTFAVMRLKNDVPPQFPNNIT